MTFLHPVNYKYFYSNNVQLRAAYYRSLSRPGFKESAQYLRLVKMKAVENFLARWVIQTLKVYEADNFDLGVEIYGWITISLLAFSTKT